MHPKNFTKVIQGSLYSTKTATLLASDEFWDGNNWERSGRNTFLYRTSGGAYFRVDLTMWQGERDTLKPLTREEAIELWEELSEREVSYEVAFDAVVEEASAGRPTYYGKPMRQTAVWLPEEMIAWLKDQGNMGEHIRALVKMAMDGEGQPHKSVD